MKKAFKINHFFAVIGIITLLIVIASCKKNCSCTRKTVIDDTIVRVNTFEEDVKGKCSDLNKEEVATYNRPVDSTTFVTDTLHRMFVTCKE